MTKRPPTIGIYAGTKYSSLKVHSPCSLINIVVVTSFAVLYSNLQYRSVEFAPITFLSKGTISWALKILNFN